MVQAARRKTLHCHTTCLKATVTLTTHVPWAYVFPLPKEKTIHPETLDPAKIPFESEGKVKTFSEKQKQRQLTKV